MLSIKALKYLLFVVLLSLLSIEANEIVNKESELKIFHPIAPMVDPEPKDKVVEEEEHKHKVAINEQVEVSTVSPQPASIAPQLPQIHISDKLPSLIHSIFDSNIAKLKSKINDLRQNQLNNPLSAFIFTDKKPEIDDQSNHNSLNSNEPKKHSLILFKITLKKDDENNALNNNLHLLGGKNDIDKKFYEFRKQMLKEGNNDDKVMNIMHLKMTGNGDEDIKHDPQVANPFVAPIPFFNYFQNGKRPYFIPKDEVVDDEYSPLVIRTDDGPLSFVSDDIDQNVDSNYDSTSERVKKCMMQQFYRLKATLYYRSILHMMFFSGLFLFSLLLTMFTLRSCRKRKAMKYHGKMYVSAIDTKNSMMHSPPTYEQIASEKVSFSPPSEYSAVKNKYRVSNASSSLVNSLAQAYKNRYHVLANKPNNDNNNADNVSVSSLPNYEEHSAKMAKNNQI